MTTDNTNIATYETVAGELTDIIQQSSLAYQVCGVQPSDMPTPVIFGARKRSGSSGFEILRVDPTKFTSSGSEGFSEEVIEDVFNLFGDNALDYLKTVQANEIADDIDVEIVDYLNEIATADTPITLDFTSAPGTSNKALLENLIVKINKVRLAIANETKRGFPSVIVASGGVCSLLLSQKMLRSDYAANKSRENIKYVGRLADADVFQDLNASTEYCLITHRTGVPGDAGVILIPIYGPKYAVRRDQEGAGLTHHFKQRFAYGQNPLDTQSTAQVSTITFSNFDVGDNINISGIGGTPVDVACTTDETTTMDLLVTEINGRADVTVSAENIGGVLTLTALVEGVAFTPVANITDLGIGAVSTVDIVTPTAAASSIFTRNFAVTLTGYDAI
jgi:hypothetical protein